MSSTTDPRIEAKRIIERERRLGFTLPSEVIVEELRCGNFPSTPDLQRAVEQAVKEAREEAELREEKLLTGNWENY